MSEFNDKKFPLYYYLGILQFLTALIAGTVSLLFLKLADGKIYDFIASFLPDVSMQTWSTIGLLMLAIQLFGNLIGCGFSFLRSDSAGSIATVIGGAEMLWMIFQYFVLQIHNIMTLSFFLLALAQLILGFVLAEMVKEHNKVA